MITVVTTGTSADKATGKPPASGSLQTNRPPADNNTQSVPSVATDDEPDG